MSDLNKLQSNLHINFKIKCLLYFQVTCFPLVFGILRLSLEPQYAYLNRSNSECIVPSGGEATGLMVHEYHSAEVTGPSSQKS